MSANAIKILVLAFAMCFSEDIPSFRIVSEQIICPSEDSHFVDINPAGITISFQPLDGIKLTYKFRIFFKTLQHLTQRETLLVWKSVRTLENRINSKDSLKISDNNVFFVDKSEIVSEISYIFHVIGITDAGVSSKEKVFYFNYSNGGLESDNAPQGNLLLIGSEVAIAGTPYILHAKVSFCKPKFDYYLRWKIFNLDEGFQELLSLNSKNLKIPSNTLQAGTRYKIEANVLESNTSNLLVKESIEVMVLKRGFEAYIIPTSTRVGINKPATFQLFIRDYDNIFDNIQVFWEYTSLNYVSQYNVGVPLSKTKFEIIFREQGRYKVTATLKLNEIEKKAMADVEIDSNIFSSYDFEEIPDIDNIGAKRDLKFPVLVVDLIPNCKTGWSSAQEDGFAYINQDELGAQLFGQTEIKDLEGMYLSEIADYENSTANHEMVLFIPSDKTMKVPWPGFQGDASYKFRLDTVCPKPYLPHISDNTATVIISYFEFVTHTNSPPVGGKLEIYPGNGTALKTIFRLSTESGKDIFLDTPLTYEFCATFENQHICFNKFCDYKALETKLPYTSEPIQLSVIICDIRKACSTFHGPNISTNYLAMTKTELTDQIKEIKEAFKRTDFIEANNLMLMTAVTYKNGNFKLLDQFRYFAEQLIEKEINKMLEQPVEKFYLPHEKVLQFVTLAKRNLEVLSINKASIFLKLLEIMEQIDSEQADKLVNPSEMPGYMNTSLEFQERFQREASDQGVWPKPRPVVNAEYFRTNLQLLESIYKLNAENSSPEKYDIANKITLLANKMCISESITKEQIYSHIASITVEKLTGSYILKKVFEIPNYDGTQWGYFKIHIAELQSRVDKYCVALVQYSGNYNVFDQTPSIYIDVIDLPTHKPFRRSSSHSLSISKSNNSFITLTINKNRKNQNTCFLKLKDHWASKVCPVKKISTKTVTCGCSQFGHIRLGIVEWAQGTSWILPTQIESTSSFPTDNQTQRIQGSPTDRFHISSTTPFIRTSVTIANHFVEVYTEEHNELKSTTVGRYEEVNSENVRRASLLAYVLPLLFIILTILLVFFVLIYYRSRKSQKKPLEFDHNWGMEFRQRVPGIKYATLHDEHIITGHFDTVKMYK